MLMGGLPQLFAGEREKTALSCPIEPDDFSGLQSIQLFCEAPEEKTALALQEALVLAEVGAAYCVPGPWEEVAIDPSQRRALLTMRIAQHRMRTDRRSLRTLIEERADDPDFDRETVELMLDGSEHATEALAARIGGTLGADCSASLVQAVERRDAVVSFQIAGDVVRAADHLCKLGCEVAHR